MASPQVSAALAALGEDSTPQSGKVSAYINLLGQITSSSPPTDLAANIIAYLDSVLGDSLGVVAARPILTEFVKAFKLLSDPQVKIETGQHALGLLAPRVVSFEEQDESIRHILADVYEAEEENTEAAAVLKGIQLDSSQRMVTDTDKLKIWIRITRNLIEVDDTTGAETYLNRAKNVFYKCDDPELRLQFQLSQARILDAQRKFLQAWSPYHILSFSPILDESERQRCLSAAITCAVLAPAGPQRSRALAQLYKDDRAPELGQDFSILEKMYLDRLLSKAEVDGFAERLAPHQLAKTSNGSTVLAKAVIEHNLLGASRLYNNIGVAELGALLGLSGEKAEEYAARMIEQGRLSGRIDQIDGFIFFDGVEGSGERTNATGTDRSFGREMRKWDSNVQGVAEEVEKVTTLLQNQFPDFVTANLVH